VRNTQNRRALPGGQRVSISDEPEEAVERGKPAVPSANGPTVGLLKIVQKREHLMVAQIRQAEPRNVTPVTLRHEAQKQPPRVSIRKDGMT
jgi:hypothetical protein